MSIYPKARQKLIRPGSNDPRIRPVGIVFHVAVSEADSLYDWFAHRSGGLESHFYVRRDGTVEQYRDTGYQADAQAAGNSWGSPARGMLSVETEGMGQGEWTGAQVRALKELTVWAAREHGFKIRKATGPFSGGVGYHRQFKAWNPHGHTCPGPDRIEQFRRVFVPWFAHALEPAKPDRPTELELVDRAKHATARAKRRVKRGGRHPVRLERLRKALDWLRKIHNGRKQK